MYRREALSGPTACAPLPASMASAALLIALSARASGTATIAGFGAATSPPALCATGAPDCACAAPAGSATARQAASASGRVVLRLTMIDGLLSRSRCERAEQPRGLADKLGPPHAAS